MADEEEIPDPFEVFVRTIDGKKTEISVIEGNTVEELKELLEEILEPSIPAADQRLIFSGRVMENERTVSFYNIKAGATINLVRQAKSAARAPPPPSQQQVPQRPTTNNSSIPGIPGFDSEGLSALMNTPMMRSITENPEMMRQMMMADPRIRQMAETNPEFRQIINDDGFMRQTAQLARNPSLMNEMMRNQDRALAHIENIPGGFQALSSMHRQLQPLTAPPEDPNAPSDEASRQIAEALGANRRHGEGVNTDALPNPWAAPAARNAVTTGSANPLSALPPFPFPPSTSLQPNPFMLPSQTPQPPSTALPGAQMPGITPTLGTASPMNDAWMQMFANAMGTAGSIPTQLPDQLLPPPEERFRDQLQQLTDMGFTDTQANIRALLMGGGQIDAAITYLLQGI
ncbi:Ubiquilin-3 [Gonapodya sp. JEL0774]|nr:Ubiquilin-3 [Gonapodya sp. JEL0774]